MMDIQQLALPLFVKNVQLIMRKLVQVIYLKQLIVIQVILKYLINVYYVQVMHYHVLQPMQLLVVLQNILNQEILLFVYLVWQVQILVLLLSLVIVKVDINLQMEYVQHVQMLMQDVFLNVHLMLDLLLQVLHVLLADQVLKVVNLLNQLYLVMMVINLLKLMEIVFHVEQELQHVMILLYKHVKFHWVILPHLHHQLLVYNVDQEQKHVKMQKQLQIAQMDII